jgi:uncharacterized protein
MQEQLLKTVKAVSFVLVASAAVMAGFQYKISVGNTYPVRTFSVDGSGDVDTTPDIATFAVSVVTDGGKDVAEVQGANTEKMNKVHAFLLEQGVEKKDLKTGQYNLAPRYDYADCTVGTACPAPKITGYSLTQTLNVKLRDMTKLGDLLSGVVNNGANTVSEVSFVVDDDASSKDAARKEALADGRRKALATAKAAGFRLGKLVTLYENASPIGYGGMGGDVADGSLMKANAAPVIEPGTQSTKVQVTMTYEIRD